MEIRLECRYFESMSELRKSKRIPFSAPIEQILIYQNDYPKLGGREVFDAKALDLSPSGIACETQSKIFPASMVYFIFSVPTQEGSRRIGCDGYVVRSRLEGKNFVLGIHFMDLSEEDQAIIDAYVESHG